MSRIAKYPVAVPDKVQVTVDASGVTVKGPLGTLKHDASPSVVVKLEGKPLRRTDGLTVHTGRPRVSYRETVVRGVTGFTYRHAKQDGGSGQWAHVVIDVVGWYGSQATTARGGRVTTQSPVRCAAHRCPRRAPAG